MGLSILTMALISLIPSLGICVFVYFTDRKEKEPLWLLALLFGVSALIYIPVYYFGKLINDAISSFFSGSYSINLVLGTTSWTSSGTKIWYFILTSLIGTALIEETVRWLILYFITNRSKHFDCMFDGIVYSVVVSMGAALAQNVRLAFENGWEIFWLKLLSSFPWYLFFGIVMGIFYTTWHTKRNANEKENRLIDEGKLKKDKIKYPMGNLIASILVPTLIHGLYSFAVSMRLPDYNILFGIVVLLLMILCVVLVFLFSKKDKTKREEIDALIKEMHVDESKPETSEDAIEDILEEDTEKAEEKEESDGKGGNKDA